MCNTQASYKSSLLAVCTIFATICPLSTENVQPPLQPAASYKVATMMPFKLPTAKKDGSALFSPAKLSAAFPFQSQSRPLSKPYFASRKASLRLHKTSLDFSSRPYSAFRKANPSLPKAIFDLTQKLPLASRRSYSVSPSANPRKPTQAPLTNFRKTAAQPSPNRRLLAVLRLIAFTIVIGGAWLWLSGKSGGDPRGWLEAMRSTDPLVFIACMAALPVIGFPVAACYLYAGAAFGFLYGWLYCLGGLFLSMSLGYWVARGFLRAPLQSLLATTRRRLPAPAERHHLRTTLLVRLVPGLSFAMQNALLALLNIPFAKYITASLVAQGLLASLMCAIAAIPRTPHWVSAALITVSLLGICLLAHFGIRRGWRQTNTQPAMAATGTELPAPPADAPFASDISSAPDAPSAPDALCVPDYKDAP